MAANSRASLGGGGTRIHYVYTPVGVQQTGKIDELCVCVCVCVCVSDSLGEHIVIYLFTLHGGGGQGYSKSSTLAPLHLGTSKHAHTTHAHALPHLMVVSKEQLRRWLASRENSTLVTPLEWVGSNRCKH